MKTRLTRLIMAIACGVVLSVSYSQAAVIDPTQEVSLRTIGNSGDQTIRDFFGLGETLQELGERELGDSREITLDVSGTDTLVIHWGGSQGGIVSLYDVAGVDEGTFVSPANGISWARKFGDSNGHGVPDGGSALMLLMGGLAMLGFFGWRHAKR